MGNVYDKEKNPNRTRQMHGRRVLYTSEREITPENVVLVLQKAMDDHNMNSSEINYLWNYYKGKQPILTRDKKVRPEINNMIVENRANEIVSFKTGYLCGEPIEYVSRNKENMNEEITTLNEYMFAEDKAAKDEEIVEWGHIGGTAYRLVLPDKEAGDTDNESPFRLFTLDPRYTAIVYSDDIYHRPMMAFTYTVDSETITHYSIYTDKWFFVVDGEELNEEESRPHSLGMIPIFEYPANNARLGAFEIVLPLLDALNNVESNRLDSVEQTVQAFIKFINCDITTEDFAALKELGAIKVKSIEGQQADVDVVKTELNQDQTHTLKDDLYNAVLTICGMPNRNGGTSTSDTGTAVLLRDGWSLAESRAKDSEHMFKRSEKQMLRLVLKICRTIGDFSLELKDIDMKFTRRNYENIQSKAQVLVAMLQQPKIHPKLAFTSCGLFTDPETAYAMSMDYYDEQMEKWQAQEVNEDEEEDDEGTSGAAVPRNRQASQTGKEVTEA